MTSSSVTLISSNSQSRLSIPSSRTRPELKLVYSRDQQKIDHLALFNVIGQDLERARKIEGHSGVPHEGNFYQAYPLSSFWAVVATFPNLEMSPGARRLWDHLNGQKQDIDIHTPRSLIAPRFRYDQLRKNKDGMQMLRPSQAAFVENAMKYKRYIGGLDTRVGKTVCYVMSHLQIEQALERPVKTLIVTPARVIWNVYDHCQDLIEDPRVEILHGNKANQRAALDRFFDDDSEILITGYELLTRNMEEYYEKFYNQLDARMIDEAHYIKNEWAKRSQAVRCLTNTEYVILGSGTPTPNGLFEIYSLLNDVNNEFFPCEWDGPEMKKSGRWEFEATYCQKERMVIANRWVTKIVGYKPQVKELRDILDTYMLRVKYADVVEQMPKVSEPIVEVELSNQHQKAYKAVIEDLREQHKEGKLKDWRVALLRLRQVAVSPRLFDIDVDSTILQQALELLEIIDEPVVVVSNFPDVARDFQRMIEDKLDRTSICVTSDWSQEQRWEAIKSFQEGDTDTYVTTVGIAKEGIPLYRASVMIMLDPTYVPSDDLQMVRRLFDVEKPDPITVYRMEAKDTVLSKIRQKRTEKGWEISLWIDGEIPSEVAEDPDMIDSDLVRKEILGE